MANTNSCKLSYTSDGSPYTSDVHLDHKGVLTNTPLAYYYEGLDLYPLPFTEKPQKQPGYVSANALTAGYGTILGSILPWSHIRSAVNPLTAQSAVSIDRWIPARRRNYVLQPFIIDYARAFVAVHALDTALPKPRPGRALDFYSTIELDPKSPGTVIVTLDMDNSDARSLLWGYNTEISSFNKLESLSEESCYLASILLMNEALGGIAAPQSDPMTVYLSSPRALITQAMLESKGSPTFIFKRPDTGAQSNPVGVVITGSGNDYTASDVAVCSESSVVPQAAAFLAGMPYDRASSADYVFSDSINTAVNAAFAIHYATATGSDSTSAAANVFNTFVSRPQGYKTPQFDVAKKLASGSYSFPSTSTMFGNTVNGIKYSRSMDTDFYTPSFTEMSPLPDTLITWFQEGEDALALYFRYRFEKRPLTPMSTSSDGKRKMYRVPASANALRTINLQIPGGLLLPLSKEWSTVESVKSEDVIGWGSLAKGIELGASCKANVTNASRSSASEDPTYAGSFYVVTDETDRPLCKYSPAVLANGKYVDNALLYESLCDLFVAIEEEKNLIDGSLSLTWNNLYEQPAEEEGFFSKLIEGLFSWKGAILFLIFALGISLIIGAFSSED